MDAHTHSDADNVIMNMLQPLRVAGVAVNSELFFSNTTAL